MEEETKKPTSYSGHARENVGKIATDLTAKATSPLSPIELEREAQKNYLNELLAAIEKGKKVYEGDFYIHVETKLEKLLQNVTRNYFFIRSTCPTPFFDQSVFKYDYKEEKLTYIWTVPCKDAAYHLKEFAIEVVKEERELLYMVLKYFDGTLLKIAKKLNGETSDLDVIITMKSEEEKFVTN
jgi:hypothetical protein